MDLRLQQLTNWVSEVLQCDDIEVTPASADASFRRYFRVKYAGQTRIVMDAPADKEDSHPFVQIAAWLAEMNITAPRVQFEDFQQGFFLLTDLGHVQYLDALNTDSADNLYEAAMRTLLAIQSNGQPFMEHLPVYDEKLLLNEMNLFRDWYLGKHLGISLTTSQANALQAAFLFLASMALQQPQVFVHRDFHSRNLMYLEEIKENPGVLDFQDAVRGPVTYDLVSLLRDCYINWPRSRVTNWAVAYLKMAQASNMLIDISEAQFIRWFDLMGIQRHLKATGIFARLNYRDNKPGYLHDIPRTMAYILSIGPDYEELAGFCNMLDELDIPARLEAKSA